jgi:hypothetical protein
MLLIIRRATAVMLAVWAAGGCATGSGGGEDNTVRKIINGFDGEPVGPRSANRLFIAQPVDSTGSPDLAGKLLIKVREYVSLDGRLGVDSDDLASDLRLEIRISKYMVERVAYDEIGRAVKKRLWITADAKLLNLKKKKVIFFEPDVQSFREFSDLAMPVEPESRVREYVLDDLAKRISSKTVSGWYTELLTDIEQRKN